MKSGWDKERVIWKKIDDTKLNFPELTEDELRGLTMGIYQKVVGNK